MAGEWSELEHVCPTVDYEVHGHLDGGVSAQVAGVGSLVLRPQLPGQQEVQSTVRCTIDY